MNKTNPKKLSLSIETLRVLADRDLDRVVGGISVQSYIVCPSAGDKAECPSALGNCVSYQGECKSVQGDCKTK